MKDRTPVICDRCRQRGYLGEGDFAALAPRLDFTPVPRKTKRHDGWTAERQRGFIEALARTGSVTRAAEAVNMAKEGAYQLRLHPKAKEFRRAWATALDFGTRVLADAALDRAINGVAVPIMHKGEQVGERRVFNERLTMWHLQHRMGDTYGGADPRSRGTHHPDTLAREDYDALDAEGQAAEDAAQEKGWADLFMLYMERVGLERRHRDAGEGDKADFYSRQLTHLEALFETGCVLLPFVQAADHFYFPDRPWTKEHGEPLRRTFLTKLFAACRAEAWRMRDEGRSEKEIMDHLIETRSKLKAYIDARQAGAPIRDPE